MLTRGKLLSLCVYTLVVVDVVLLLVSLATVGVEFTYPAVFEKRAMFSFTSSRDLRLTYQCLVWLVLGKRALQVS